MLCATREEDLMILLLRRGEGRLRRGDPTAHGETASLGLRARVAVASKIESRIASDGVATRCACAA